MLSTLHFPAAFGTFLTWLDAFIHTADLLAIHRTDFADFGANPLYALLEMIDTEKKIGQIGRAHV